MPRDDDRRSGPGGPRPGSGRPPLPEDQRGVQVTVMIPRWALDLVEAAGPKGSVIRGIVERWARRRR